MTRSVIIPFDPSTAAAAGELARALHGKAQVLLAGSGEPNVPASNGTQVLRGLEGKGSALREALPLARGEVTILQDPDLAYSLAAHDALAAPIDAGVADAVFGARSRKPLPELALGRLSRLVTDAPLTDPLSGQRAFRTEALRSITLKAEGDDVDSELLVKLSAHLFRFVEVPVELSFEPRRSLSAELRRARTLLRYATLQDDADNRHEGYSTLARMESGAPNYNAWLGQRFRPHCGRRVLEIGAGIGTITAQLEEGRELVVALEVDPFYVDRLKNRFRHKPHVRPTLSDVALADWEALRAERIDTIVLSNVLEHIPDDGEAVRRFGEILQPQGKLLILVPALPALFGSIDEAVGHYRRYTPESLRAVLEGNGFSVEHLEWGNLVGIPGWFLNGRVFKRRSVPPLQLRLYDQLAPYIARAEAHLRLPVGMSLFAVARARVP